MLSPNNDEGGAPSLTGGCGSARTEESPSLEVHDGSTVLHLSPGSALVQHPGPSMPVAGSVASLTETYRNAGSLTEPKRTSGSESEDTTATEEQAPVPITADAKKLKSRCPQGSGFRVVATSCIPGLAKEPTFQQVVGVLSIQENDATIPSHTAQEDALPQVEAPIASGKDGAASSSSGDDEAINGKNRSSGGVAEPRDPRVATVQAWAQNACSLAARQAPLSNFSGFVHAANNGKLAHAREAGHLADQTTDTVAAAPLCSAGSPNVGTSRAPPQPPDTALRNTQRIASSSPQLGCKSMDIALQDPPRTVDRTSITEEPNKSSPASTRGCPNNPSCCADTSPRSVSGREVTQGGSSGNPTSMAEQQLLAAYRECFLLLAAAQRKEELRVFEFVLGGGSRDARLCGCKETQRHSDGAELNDASTRRNSSGPNADGLERTSEEQRIQATGPCEASPNAANLGESYTDSTAIEASIKEDDAEATPPNYSVPGGVETDSRLELKDVRNGGDASCVSPENDTDRSLSARGGNLEAEGAAATQDNANTDDRLWPANNGSDSGSRADKSNITTCGRNIYGRTGTYDDGNEEREASRKKRRTGWPSVLAPETWSERT
ncbi:hypothetical protein BESB_034650 [Besnoitia besnoiti]|uniref:Uncharacterized protein n=1 Tax=Besnoitia besnoiti TaxID=94643 RepID=A0A2A9MMK3_BESBE|nr:hypothetical protein BESB_034650 [Besnoitia besnoiti]PFH37007.1 hypothetical protein BESB_034650 [Besnoitia besnoiti]